MATIVSALLWLLSLLTQTSNPYYSYSNRNHFQLTCDHSNARNNAVSGGSLSIKTGCNFWLVSAKIEPLGVCKVGFNQQLRVRGVVLSVAAGLCLNGWVVLVTLVTSCTTGHMPHTTDHMPQTTDHMPQTTGHMPHSTCHRPHATDHTTQTTCAS